jgi:hypothetical protein
MNRPVQMVNGGAYLRGLIEQGARKSLEPMVERLGGDADYQSLQQFLADSPWDPAVVVRAVAERVVPAIRVEAWVLDDTGFPKDGKRSPGVKRQYSGTLGKIGNCQIGVSVHAVGSQGTVPLGWVLTDTLDGDDGAIEDGDVGGERPNDQRGAGGVGNGGDEGGRGRSVPVVRRALRPLRSCY